MYTNHIVNVRVELSLYLLYDLSVGLSIPTSSPEPAGWLDTLHVVLSGQPNGPSKPKGLHTGFSGLPLIGVKGTSSYM